MMDDFLKYTLCHGSGNRFVLVDGVAEAALLDRIDCSRLAQEVGYDGLLLLRREGEGYAMQMYNSDGTRAEMCGNGIRCVARLVNERYLKGDKHFILHSGGRRYPIRMEAPIFEGLPTFGVEIGIRRRGEDFPRGGEAFLAAPIEELAPGLRFTYLNLGNPHIVACVEEIDYALLTRLGERVKELREWFPRGINLSFFRHDGKNRLFAATFERGVGLTESCGTAMTASATAATLLGLTQPDEQIEVFNRGGVVRCYCHLTTEGLSTHLVGNATFEAYGHIEAVNGGFLLLQEGRYEEEIAAYQRFLMALTKNQ